ncbi:MAG TPA: 1-phosphofructokinase [Microbacterium sp.]|jgi:1-phosphofructokinase|uniref:1-phosphofructokinase family hexose kinase n=1 Tax=unclassified Microbacterium TaxID=2609290 RepID=UPI000C57C598|nr:MULTISPECIES: 1-phosphofructokinase family hexose kinase [unclassified Microbacterium]MBU19798.1 1-phosphofructokinase [Microbacterium sp.]HBS08117.1 1-phosphofructokinase [Microbacterium sp.]HBU42350.1 1-phosphofructokinase [Microbacterium sp.]
MIVTVTINPSVDRTIQLPSPLVRDAVLRASAVSSQAAGKGVNVSRALAHASVATRAIVRADYHDPYVRELVESGLAVVTVDPGASVRTNISLVEPDGTTTKINEPGSPLSAAAVAALHDVVAAEAPRASWVVLAGSLPPGADVELLADLARTARMAAPAVRIAVDTSGAPLTALRTAGVRIDLIKPNLEELAELTGSNPATLGTPEAVASACTALRADGIAAVLATLGAAGAVLASADGAWHATHPPVIARSTVGAGDSSLAGYLIADAERLSPAARLARAVAYGSAAVSLPGTTIPRPTDTRPDQVTVTELHLPAMVTAP